MPTELEELVEFLHHGNTQIRQLAVENAVPYSKAQPSIFKANGLAPIKDLKMLIKDYPPIAKNALTILINISGDRIVLDNLSNDDAFLKSLLLRVTNIKEPNSNELSMLLANMAKSDSIERLLTLKRDIPPSLSTSPIAIDQLMEAFVKGPNGAWNPKADFDYLAYLFADLAKFRSGAHYLTTPQAHDSLPPVTKLLPFTVPTASVVRRLGVSTALKNTSLHPSTHGPLLSAPISILPFILLPLADGSDTYSPSETELLPEEMQFLEPDVKREGDVRIMKMYLESLVALCTDRQGREAVRGVGGYAVIRELHLGIEDEGVREWCERLVDLLMRDEEGEESGARGFVTERGGGDGPGRMITQREIDEDNREEDGGRMVTKTEVESESDDDEKIMDIF